MPNLARVLRAQILLAQLAKPNGRSPPHTKKSPLRASLHHPRHNTMSSLMRLLSHRSSATAEGGGNNDTANAATGFASSATSTPRSGSSFPASPSINDFSMGTEADVAEWGTWAPVSGGQGRGFEALGGGRREALILNEKRKEPKLRPQRPFSFPDPLDIPSPPQNSTDTTTEKALPSPATSLGRVDGRRSLDSVLSTTSVFAGGAVAGMNNNNGSVTSSPLSAGTLSPRASLDSARGSADVRALLWRASMPGECLSFVFCVRGAMRASERGRISRAKRESRG